MAINIFITLFIFINILSIILCLLKSFCFHFRMLRETVPPKILINLCAAILFMNIVFVVGVEKSNISTGGCQAIAFLIQYFFLCIFFWSGVEGFHSARGLVFPMKVEIRMFIQKSCVFGWGK